MKSPPRHLVVGIGSPHGDDQAGWRLVDILTSRGLQSAQLRKATVPHDLIDWLELCDSLHVVDACQCATSLQRIDLSGSRAAIETKTRSCGSHQLEVGSVLELADSLQLLPQRVTLWAIPGQQFRPGADIGDACSAQVARCADLIQTELGDESIRGAAGSLRSARP